MQTTLFVLNDAPYGSERPFNALRHALALSQRGDAQVRVFLMADAVACGVAGQTLPEGYYSIERLLKGLTAKGAPVAL